LLRLEASAVYDCDWDESILAIQKWAPAGSEREIIIEDASEVVSHAVTVSSPRFDRPPPPPPLVGMVVAEAGDEFPFLRTSAHNTSERVTSYEPRNPQRDVEDQLEDNRSTTFL